MQNYFSIHRIRVFAFSLASLTTSAFSPIFRHDVQNLANRTRAPKTPWCSTVRARSTMRYFHHLLLEQNLSAKQKSQGELSRELLNFVCIITGNMTKCDTGWSMLQTVMKFRLLELLFNAPSNAFLREIVPFPSFFPFFLFFLNAYVKFRSSFWRSLLTNKNVYWYVITVTIYTRLFTDLFFLFSASP